MGKRILIIEDEDDIQTYLATLFEENGYEVSTASNGKAGAAKMAEQRPDLICLDILMPEKSGIALYREIKKNEEFKEIPVVMVTGFKAEEFPNIDFKKFIYERSVPGPDGYVEKPIDRNLLLDTVRRVLEGGRSSP
jgi:CheY-like chemotaxis protein